jgi:hypothetical protein
MYSLMRRAITEADFKFLFRSLPQIRDVGIVPYGGINGDYTISINALALANYTITIDSVVYSFQNTYAGLTADAIINQFNLQLKNDELVIANVTGSVGTLSLHLITKSSKSLISISSSTNMTVVQNVAQQAPSCCVLEVNYLSENTVTTPVRLTTNEYLTIASTIDQYKPVGLTLFYVAATKRDVPLSYTISLIDNANQTLVMNLITKIIDDFHLRIDVNISSYDIAVLIRKYANLKYGQDLISDVLDNNVTQVYIDKAHFSNIILTTVFI